MSQAKADSKIRILLVDDHLVLRSGLRALLNMESDFDVVGEASNGIEAVKLAETLRPDIIVMDVSMPEMDGLKAAEEIQSLDLQSKIVMLTVHADEQYLFQTLKAGASGYVHKSSADSELIDAIRTANRGDVFLYPSAIKKLLGEYLRGESREADDKDPLTNREREVLKATVEGYTNNEIAEQLVISPKTVDTYRQRIMEKLNLHHRSELIRYALKRGYLVPGD
ncbi:MAG: DNA-binding response regulator [Chloroflexi bacterium]|nr:MAG: DNA-binding response regulator [Chloroflexota bacterium]